MAKSINHHEEISTVTDDNTQMTINEDEEKKHFQKVIGALLYYR